MRIAMPKSPRLPAHRLDTGGGDLRHLTPLLLASTASPSCNGDRLHLLLLPCFLLPAHSLGYLPSLRGDLHCPPSPLAMRLKQQRKSKRKQSKAKAKQSKAKQKQRKQRTEEIQSTEHRAKDTQLVAMRWPSSRSALLLRRPVVAPCSEMRLAGGQRKCPHGTASNWAQAARGHSTGHAGRSREALALLASR